jgi:DNA-binding PadR family transcriptional regulator
VYRINYSSYNYSNEEQVTPIRRQITHREALPTEVLSVSDLAFHILLALGDGPSHGYAIGQDVEERSNGRLDPTTGALYQALRRLAEEGLIAPASAPDEADARRKYFALTMLGRRAAAEETRRLEGLVRTARQRKLYPQRA